MRIEAIAESNQVVVLVGLPLTLLMIGALVLRRRLLRRTTATFSDFSLRVRRVGRENACVTLTNSAGSKEFEADIGRNQIDIRVPEKLQQEEIAILVLQLVQGLQELRFEYLIYKAGPAQEVPEAERTAAIAEIRAMGFDVEIAGDGRRVRTTKRFLGSSGTPADMGNIDIRRWMQLIRTASGRRATPAVLARSSAALDRV